jgi:predicted transcriptional regulator of viral defense system
MIAHEHSTSERPDHKQLFAVASSQGGYFTAEQAREARFSSRLLQHHSHTGRFQRIRRGVYRLRDYPHSPHDEIMAATMAVGNSAVVSHDSALELLGLSDVIPDAVHLSVPRSKRHSFHLPGVIVHTTTRPLEEADVTVREGMRVTSAIRTILDTAEIGVGPEQVEAAVREAIQRGMLTAHGLDEAAQSRPSRVRHLVRTTAASAP